MDQYQIENALRLVDGYYIPRPGESPVDTFARAQAEAELQLRKSAAAC